MSELVTTIWGITILIVLLGCLPYGIWIIYSLCKRRWKRVAMQVVIPGIAFLVLYAVSSVLNAKAYSEYLAGLYDTGVKFGAALYEYDSPRSFNGDGYSIAVYRIPEEIRRRFESADERLLSNFPKRPNYRGQWSSQHWREAQLNPEFKKYLDSALTNYVSDKETGLSAQFDAIRYALSRKRTYYAFFSYGDDDYVGDIDLFIVDLQEGRLYSINHNT